MSLEKARIRSIENPPGDSTRLIDRRPNARSIVMIAFDARVLVLILFVEYTCMLIARDTCIFPSRNRVS